MNDYRHILLAVDFTPEAATIAARASELAHRYGAQLSMAHVVEFLPPINLAGEPVAAEWLLDEQMLLQGAEQRLQQFAEAHGLAAVARHVVLGSTRHEILRLAVEQSVDMIVIGSHGRHGLSRLLGSTARAVLNDAPCDVLAVRIKSNP